MPRINLVSADVTVLREAAAKLAEHGETGHAYRLDALADYLDTAINQAIGEAPLEHF